MAAVTSCENALFGGREFDFRWGTKIVRSFLVVSEFPFFQVKMFTGSVRVLLTTVVKKIIIIIKFKRKFNIQYQLSPRRQPS